MAVRRTRAKLLSRSGPDGRLWCSRGPMGGCGEAQECSDSRGFQNQAWEQGCIVRCDGGRHRHLFTSASFCDPGTVTASSLRMRMALQRHGSTGK